MYSKKRIKEMLQISITIKDFYKEHKIMFNLENKREFRKRITESIEEILTDQQTPKYYTDLDSRRF